MAGRQPREPRWSRRPESRVEEEVHWVVGVLVRLGPEALFTLEANWWVWLNFAVEQDNLSLPRHGPQGLRC